MTNHLCEELGRSGCLHSHTGEEDRGDDSVEKQQRYQEKETVPNRVPFKHIIGIRMDETKIPQLRGGVVPSIVVKFVDHQGAIRPCKRIHPIHPEPIDGDTVGSHNESTKQYKEQQGARTEHL